MIKNNTKFHYEHNVAEIKSNDNKLLGLWIYLMSDCIMFAVLFSVYFIISDGIQLNIVSQQVYSLSNVFLETLLLLTSSLSCSLVSIAKNKKNIDLINFWLLITFFLGFIFLFMEIREFYLLSLKYYTPDQHAFFSIFFTLISMHGMHIFFGLLLILAILYQIKKLGLTSVICTRISCLTIFWHFLDIIWVCIYTFVYLNGAI